MIEQTLNCDICEAPMIHTKESTELGFITDIFKCIKCKQAWGFNNTEITRMIVKALYPDLEKMNTKMRHESLDYNLLEFLFKQKALLISGRITQSEFDERKLNAIRDIDEEHQRVPIKKWWKFWKRQ